MNTTPITCQYCQREITPTQEGWLDPYATGDDSLWRYVCDEHDTLVAEHEPEVQQLQEGEK